MRGFFVTGTDTGVGKTVVSAALMHRLRRATPLRYWKPIQTGVEMPGGNDTAEVMRLGLCSGDEIHDFGLRLRNPVSPHLAAQRAGIKINLQEVALLGNASDDPAWVVEGAGGLLVPVNESQTIADLVAKLNLPLIIAARSGLGTINHTLLTLEAARMRSLKIAAVVMVGEPNASNRDAIRYYGEIDEVFEMPHFDPLPPGVLGDWATKEFDPEGVLLHWLR